MVFLPILHSPADIARWLMIEAGQGTNPTLIPPQDWATYVGVEPDFPDRALTLNDTLGQSDGRSMCSGELDQHFGIMLHVRGQTQVDGRVKGEALRLWMSQEVYEAEVSVAINLPATYILVCFAKISQLLSVGTDAPVSKRWTYSLNLTVALRRIA